MKLVLLAVPLSKPLRNPLKYNVKDFALAALESQAPVDLGSRCVLFYELKSETGSKEGPPSIYISAGLSYSVIKNAIYKVTRFADLKSWEKRLSAREEHFTMKLS